MLPALNYLIDKKITLSINSNGAIIEKRHYDFIKRNNINLFISFPCSNDYLFNKITNSKNGFKHVTKSLLSLQNENIPFVLNMVISKLNLNEIENTISFLKNTFNIKKICITRVGKPVNSTEDFSKLMLSYDDMKILQLKLLYCIKQYNIEIDTACPYTPCSIYSQEAFNYFAYKKACTAGKTSYSIDCYGNVKACPRESKSYGNILTDRFSEIWNNMRIWRDGSIIPQECKSCSKYSKCLGGCRMDKFPFSKRYDELDCISNINNLPIKYVKKEINKLKYKENDLFEVFNSVQFLKDDNCIRVSNNKKYCYITNEFSEFIRKNKIFSPLMLSDNFKVSISDIYNIIDILVINNIIYKKNKKEDLAYE